MIRLFVAVLDVLLLTMLVTFAVDAQDRRAVPQKRWLLAAAVTWLLLAIATVLDSDPLYILVMAAYVLVCVVSLTTQARLRTLVATAFLTLIAGFPLNVIVFVLNVLGGSISLVSAFGENSFITHLVLSPKCSHFGMPLARRLCF